MLRRTVLSLAALILASRMARADGFMRIDRTPEQPAVIPMAVKYHKVEVVIDNQVATTEVDQVFTNPNSFQVEATYMFPVPAGASVSKLSMWIDGKEMEAELLDADKARQTYEDIVRSQKDPALLEYVGQKMFKLRVFPILPNENKRVKLSYSESLSSDAGLCVYRYPLNTEKFSSAPLEDVRVSVKVKSNVPLKSLMSPSHPVDVARKSDFEATAVYEDAKVTPDKDFLFYFTQQEGDFGMNLVTQKVAGEDGYFMLLVSPKAETKADEVVQRDVCFVLDTSMSMAEEDRMPQARKALKAGLQTLNPGDRFNVVTFSTEVRSWKEGLVDMNADNIASAAAYIDTLKARGGTNIQDAMTSALGMSPKDSTRPYMVIFMTDGEPTIGETDCDKLVKITKDANKSNTRIFTLGVGFDLNVNLLDRIADENHGLREYITPTENLEVKMSGYYAKIGAPVLSDVKLEIPGADIYDIYPKTLSDVFKGQQIVVYGRFAKEGSRAIKLSGMVNGKPKEFTYEAKFPATGGTHDAVPRLWAISKIGHLMDAIRLQGEKDELKKEVVALAKEFGVMTKYTSFLVLEDNLRMRSGPNPAPAMAPADRAWQGDHNEAASKDAEKGRDGMGMAGGAGGVDVSRELKKMQEGKSENSDAFERKAAGGRFDDQKEGQNGQSAVTNIGGRTFYLVDGIWMDQKIKGGGKDALKIEYLSDEYFKLLAKPGMGKILALGEHILLMDGEQAVEIVPSKKTEPK